MSKHNSSRNHASQSKGYPKQPDNSRSISGRVEVTGAINASLASDLISEYQRSNAETEKRERSRFTVERLTLFCVLTVGVFNYIQTREAIRSAGAAHDAAITAEQARKDAKLASDASSIASAQQNKDTLDKMQAQINASRANFIEDERPYIWHDALKSDESDNRFPGMQVYWTNYGKSPALRFSTMGRIFCSKDALAQAYKYLARARHAPKWESVNGILPPGISTGVPTPNRGYDTFTTELLTPEKRIQCGGPAPSLQRVVVAAWEYYDLSGKRYYGEFCNGVHLGIVRGYDASGNCKKHNSVE